MRIYSPAKTVVDCFKYRYKIGLDIAKLARLSTIEAHSNCWQSRRCETITSRRGFANDRYPDAQMYLTDK